MSDDERPDINAVIEHYGGTTKDRRSYMTHCLFHEDRTPSLSVETERGLWKCQSCGEGGDVYNLVMIKEGITNFREARAFVASLGLATGSSGGGGREVPRRSNAHRRTSANGSGYRPRYRSALSSGDGD